MNEMSARVVQISNVVNEVAYNTKKMSIEALARKVGKNLSCSS